MSATVKARGLSAGFADRTLFTGLDLVVAPGDVVGLVEANGAGKSTLLKILAGIVMPVAGDVTLSPSDAAVGYLPQEVERPAGETVAGHLTRRTGVDEAQRQLDEVTDALAAGTSGAEDNYSPVLDRWLALGAPDLDTRTAAVFADLGLQINVDTPMTALSGGQSARVGLAALMLSRFDFLLLDEPTNDLDLDGLARLERFVTGARVGIMVVSHDREFLARCVTSVVELDLAQRKIAVFGGGYDAYLAEREVARRHAQEAYDEYADKRDDLTERGRMQRGWMDQGLRKQAFAQRKDNDKVSRASRIEQTEKQASKVRQTDRMIERLPEVAEPRKEWRLQYSIQPAGRSGSVVATLRDVVVDCGDFRLGPVSLQMDLGDRIGVTGPNGSGKSTLLATLLGRMHPTSGAASLGEGVQIGEVDQARALLAGPGTLLDAFAAQVPEWSDNDVRTLLAKFGLGSAHVLRPTASVSPGERTRAALALLQAKGVNLLVLDEPTNHLDLPAIEQLELALDSYTGTLLLVTHDRRMLDAVRLTRRWRVDRGSVTESAEQFRH